MDIRKSGSADIPLSDKTKPIANPLVVLREEFDDWAVLFDPDTGNAFGLNPVGVFVWKRLDGRHTPAHIAGELRETCENLPDETEGHIQDFIRDLLKQGLAGHELDR
jgi:SynChlorMet cassette protein ScmD